MIPQKIPTEDARSGHPVRGTTAARPTPRRTSGIDPNVCAEYARITLKSVMNLGLRASMPMPAPGVLRSPHPIANAYRAPHPPCSLGNARPAYSRQSLNSISVCVCPLLPFPWPKRRTRSPSGPIGSAGVQNCRQPTPCRQCPTGADRARAPTRHQRSHCQVARHAQAQSREC